MISLAPIHNGQLWQWTATDQFGKSRQYQAHGPDCPESRMLAELQATFRNVTITGLERVPDTAYKPATGPVESHTFDFGYHRNAMAELRGEKHPAHNVVQRLIHRRTIPRR